MLLLTAVAGLAVLAPVAPAHAQREIVQPLPPPEMADLRRALQRLAVEPRDVNALIDAGNASLALEDIDAAIAFFGRAEVLEPGNARVKLGLAGAFVVSRRPVEALRLFAEAERAGADASQFAAKRGLAFDLVGDNASAQTQYRAALARRDDPRVREQLAISQAVAGDRAGFEATLLPLLQKQDMSAFRTRAFGLAILKRETEAAALAKDVMPPALAQAFTPNLGQLPQLTAVEQVAAVHLGVFPEKPGLAQTRIAVAPATASPARAAAPAPAPARASAPVASAAGSSQRLRPSGAPLGRSGQAETPAADRSSGRLRPEAGRPIAGSSRPSLATAAAPAAAPAVRSQVVASSPAAVSVPAPVAAPPVASAAAPPLARRPDLSSVFAGLTPATVAAPAPGAVDVTRVTAPRDPKPQKAPRPAAVAAADTKPAASAPAKPQPRVAAKAPAKPTAKPAAAKPAKEVKPAKLIHPARVWVQLAAGANRDAMSGEWRRLSRSGGAALSGKAAHVAETGRRHRLLAGPYATVKAADEAVRALKKAGVESFRYESPEGQEVVKLN